MLGINKIPEVDLCPPHAHNCLYASMQHTCRYHIHMTTKRDYAYNYGLFIVCDMMRWFDPQFPHGGRRQLIPLRKKLSSDFHLCAMASRSTFTIYTDSINKNVIEIAFFSTFVFNITTIWIFSDSK